MIRPNLLNHLTIGYNHRHIYEAPDYVNTFPSDLANQIYLKGNPNAADSGRFDGLRRGRRDVGQHASSRIRASAPPNIKEQMAWIKGRHSVKFGMEYLAGIYRRLDNNNTWGNVSFSAAGTGNQNVANSGNDFASFLLGTASGGSFRYPDDTAFHWPYYAWYAQDDFKVSRQADDQLRPAV